MEVRRAVAISLRLEGFKTGVIAEVLQRSTRQVRELTQAIEPLCRPVKDNWTNRGESGRAAAKRWRDDVSGIKREIRALCPRRYAPTSELERLWIEQRALGRVAERATEEEDVVDALDRALAKVIVDDIEPDPEREEPEPEEPDAQELEPEERAELDALADGEGELVRDAAGHESTRTAQKVIENALKRRGVAPPPAPPIDWVAAAARNAEGRRKKCLHI
jgi:hypothetical protein